jgi:cytochrome c-type biogenesis protein CcmF
LIAEIGHFALFLALAMAFIGAAFPPIGLARRDGFLIALAGPAVLAQFVFVLVAFLALLYGYVVSDFSILAVANNSHTMKPLIYKISGVWGNHEGSLLLWVLVLTGFSSAVALFAGTLPHSFKARVLSVQSSIAFGFLAFTLFTSNPFARLDPSPIEGSGLNPLLQDPGLAFHPPVLYVGYVGFSIAFSFAVAALLEGRITAAWARWVRPWTLVAWVFLTSGIALGSWWAYYELGWGGWWFWDPVENASFMPWLAGTALVHSVIVVEKREALKAWTVLLAILTFSLSLLGTFLVRSGVLTSVHAFAVDPARGVFILAFLFIVVGGSLTLFAIRSGSLKPGGFFAPISREGALVFNNLFLVTALATVFFGTLYPLFVDAILGEKLSVGGPYYNLTFMPLMVPVVAAMAVGPLMPWKRSDLKGILGRLKFMALIAVAAAFGIWTYVGDGSLLALLGLLMGLWLAGGVLFDIAQKARMGKMKASGSLRRLAGQPRSQWGMWLAHFGVAVVIFGITISEAWTSERLTIMTLGSSEEVAGYEFTLDKIWPVAGPNYSAVRARFQVIKNGEPVASLEPEQRIYTTPTRQTTEAAIRTLALGDLYAVIGDASSTGGWSVRLYFKPLVAWLWGGAFLMMLGGLISLSDRRLRIALMRKKAPSPSPVVAE